MQYQVPRNVDTRFTFFPDFGMKELFICIAGAFIGLIAQFLVGLLISNIIVRIIVFIIFPLLAFFLSKPFNNGMSLLTLLVQLKKFNSRPKRYFFVRREL